MSKVLMYAAAIGAAIVFAAPASAKGGYSGNGYKVGHGKTMKMMPVRSNKYGARRGHVRSDYVHGLNSSRTRRY